MCNPSPNNPWIMIGTPVIDRKNSMSYDVTFNKSSGEIAINPVSIKNAGRLSQVRTNLLEFMETGLPKSVKNHIKKHQSMIERYY